MHTPAKSSRFVRTLITLAAIPALVQLVGIPTAHAKTGIYRINIIRVIYKDTTSTPHTVAQLKLAASEIHNYFDKLSYGTLDMQVKVGEARVDGTRSSYWTPCATDGTETRVPCPPDLTKQAVFSAATSGLSFTDVDGISILSPWCARDYTYAAPPLFFLDTTVNGTYTASADFECPAPTGFGWSAAPSGVWWSAWAHELGHQLQVAQFGWASLKKWDGHPSGYASGYDLMDSCYPCHDSTYSLSGPPVVNGTKRVFDWLPAAAVKTVEEATGSISVDLRALERKPEAGATQGVKLPFGPGLYYLIEARQRTEADAGVPGPGIWDEGIHILQVEETRDPPVALVQPCDAPGTCMNPDNPAWAASCGTFPLAKTASEAKADCWPHRLWHVGETFEDAGNQVRVHVDGVTKDGYRITVTRFATAITPEPLTHPPITIRRPVTDLWIDSSCNGYESQVGPSGLRFGRDDSGAVNGTGDVACALHENRLYLRVKNLGTAVAGNVSVTFETRDGMSVASREWTPAGTATSLEFPALAALAPQQSAEVFVAWTPTAQISEAQISEGHYNATVAVRAHISPLPGERVRTDNDTETMVSTVEAVVDARSGRLAFPQQSFTLQNPVDSDRDELVILASESRLPTGVLLDVNDGQSQLWVGGRQLRQIPLSVQVPSNPHDRPRPGTSYLVEISALQPTTLHNPGIAPGWPQNWPVNDNHAAMHSIGSVLYDIRVVTPSALTLKQSKERAGLVGVTGRLTPAVAGATVAVDWTDSQGQVITRLATTDRHGNFSQAIPRTNMRTTSARAIWQGAGPHSSAVSPAVTTR